MTSVLDLALVPNEPRRPPRLRRGHIRAVADAESTTEHKVAEFFAGIGLARMGLENARGMSFKVSWANDLDTNKHHMYAGHFEDDEAHYHVQDIREIAEDIVSAGVPRDLGLAWASFPCTDLSLAGGRQGLAGPHSQTFYSFAKVLKRLGHDRPPVVALENVNGFATSHNGADIKAAVRSLNELDYSVDILTLNARRWVPQSRPRLFLVGAHPDLLQGVRRDDRRSTVLRPGWLDPVLDFGLVTHRSMLPEPPAMLDKGWTALVDESDPAIEWWDDDRTDRFLRELSPIQTKRVGTLASTPEGPHYRTAYRRMRNGKPAWEIRADDIAGCLRTARGGSSKQAVVRIHGESLAVRWMTPGEYAKLMGAPGYRLPAKPNQSIMGFGDAVCVNAVQWLAEEYLGPLLAGHLAG